MIIKLLSLCTCQQDTSCPRMKGVPQTSLNDNQNANLQETETMMEYKIITLKLKIQLFKLETVVLDPFPTSLPTQII